MRIAVKDNESVIASEGKFGVGAATAERLLRQASGLGPVPYGISFHVGSQKLTPHAWRQAIGVSGEIMRRLEVDDIRLAMVDVGGGFAAR